MKLFYFLLCFIFTFSLNAQDSSLPFPEQAKVESASPEIPEDLKGLVWNKWNTNNFIIISIDKNQGLYLKNNIEKIKTNLITRWGLDDFDFTKDCKIVCVSNNKLLNRIFKLDSPKFEVRKNKDNKIELSAIWFSLEDYKSDIPLLEIMNVCMAEYQLNNKIPNFCNQGMCFLSQNPNLIMQKILSNKDSLSNFDFSQMNDVQSAVVCLLMRKEYGQDNFIRYLDNQNFSCYGFDSEEKFRITLDRYCVHLLEDLENNVTPKNYIEINRR